MYSHATSLSTISSIVTILFIIYLSSGACIVGASSQQLQHQAQLQPQPHHHLQQQQLQTQATTTSNDNDELLRQLLRLTAAGNQQQQAATAQESNEFKFNAAKSDDLAAKTKQSLAAERARQKKLVLKRKLHKLVDDLVDEPGQSDEEPQARKRDSLVNQQVQPREQRPVDETDNSKLMLVMKRKPFNDNNELGDQLGEPQPQQQQQQQQPQLRPVSNMNEHTRNILDDTFGIRRDSIFTSNNHLGLKGVPKFGSDEQF